MHDSHCAVGEGTRVHLNFALRLADGGEVDSNFGAEPVSFAVGDGSLLPGFERCLFGLLPGDRRTFSIPPEDGFGQPNPNNVQRIPREQFAEDMDLSPGMVCSFADAAGTELPGVIREAGADSVTVDFNHPLAGRTIEFEVHIHRVEPLELH